MKVPLHYGRDIIILHIPDKNISQLIQPWHNDKIEPNQTLVSDALTTQQTKNFQDRIAGKTLCVLLTDGTRDMPIDDIFEKLFTLLQKTSHILFLICTGTHNADTVANAEIKEKIAHAAAKAELVNFQTHTHDCQRTQFINAGKTSHGTEVMFNAVIKDADVFLVLSDIKCHYFAGYSNPVKNFVPGICSYETTEQNHSLALDDRSTYGSHPWHSNPSKRSNPLANDQLEAMELIVKDRGVYALVTISTSGKIQWIGFDHADKITPKALDLVDKMNTHAVTPSDRLIVSPGGLPNDIDLYIAQRALEMTKSAVKDNGEILFISACPQGIGQERTTENFYDRLTAPLDEVLQSIQAQYKLFSHKPYKFARLIQRLRKIWMYTQIPDNLVESIHLYPTDDPQRIVDRWLTENPDIKITIVSGANKIALYHKSFDFY